jgi:hypothetical protein
MAEVKKLATEYTLEVELLGRGLAIAQDPPPGTILAGPKRRVRVRFSASMGEG